MFTSARMTLRTASRRVAGVSQKRTMAGGHGPKPEWTGIDKTVRTYFPEDWQLAGAILGGYTSLILLARLRSAFKGKAPEVAVVAAPTTTTTGIPSIESPEFETYLQSEAFVQLLESEDQLAALVKD